MNKRNLITKRNQWLLIGGLVSALFFISLTGCSKEPKTETANTTTTANETRPAAESGAVARVNGMDIEARDIRFHFRQAEELLLWDYYEMHEDFEIDHSKDYKDGKTFGRAIREEAAKLAAFISLSEDYARGQGVTLSDDDRSMIDEYFDNLVEYYGDELEELLLRDGFENKAHFKEILNAQFLLDNLINAIAADDAEFAKFSSYMSEEEEAEELLGAKHILVNYDYFETKEEAEALALELLARAQAGEDFDMLIQTYGQDPGMESFTDGYSFASGDMVPEFEQATRDLEIGGISGLVPSDYGIHIIMRTESNEADWHLLRGTQPRTLEDRKMEAVYRGLENLINDAQMEFLPALDHVPGLDRE